MLSNAETIKPPHPGINVNRTNKNEWTQFHAYRVRMPSVLNKKAVSLKSGRICFCWVGDDDGGICSKIIRR